MAAVALALLAALLFAAGTVLQQKVAATASDEESLQPGFLLRLARRPQWLLGIALDAAGFVCQAIALGLGRLVVVQPILATSVVFALPLGARLSGQHVGRRQLGAAVAVTAGLAAFLVVADPTGGVDDASAAAWAISCAVIAVLCAGLYVAGHRRDPGAKATLLGIAAGVLFGLSAALTKAIVELLDDDGVAAVVTDWHLYALVVVGYAGMTLSQTSLQTGRLAPAISTQMVFDPVASLLLGILAFDERLHTSAAGVAGSLAAIAVMFGGLVVLASAQESGEPGEPRDRVTRRAGVIGRRPPPVTGCGPAISARAALTRAPGAVEHGPMCATEERDPTAPRFRRGELSVRVTGAFCRPRAWRVAFMAVRETDLPRVRRPQPREPLPGPARGAGMTPAVDRPPRFARSEQVAGILDALPAVVGVLRGERHVIELANQRFRDLAGGRPVLGRPAAEVFGDPEDRPFLELLDRVLATGLPCTGAEALAGAGRRATRPAWFDFAVLPLRGDGGDVDGTLVHAVDISRQVDTRQRLTESERRLRALVDADLVGVAVADDQRMLEANDAFLAMLGADRAALEAGGLRWREHTPPEWRAGDERALATLLETGRVGPYEKEFADLQGRRVPVLIGAALLEREPFRCVAFFLDLSERRAAERERERLLAREREARREAELTAGRIGRLQTVTAALSAAISAQDVARMVVEEAMAALGADAALIVRGAGEEAVVDHAVGFTPERLTAWRRFGLDEGEPLSDAMRSGEPVLISGEDDWLHRYPASAPATADFAALAGVPFGFGDRALGAMALAFSKPRTFTAGDRGFLVALARQAGQALERARLYEERAYVASTLQAGLLPETLAEVPGLEVAVRYHSISDGGDVGGDFYDLFDIADDRWLVVVGDVCGKGTAAAVLTGLARHTLRAIAMREREPVAMLAFLNDALRRQSLEPGYCTVGCATLTPTPEGGLVAELASGGHPCPLLVRGGRVEEVPVSGTMLGVEGVPQLEQVALRLGPGDVLVLYTDGVTDARSPARRALRRAAPARGADRGGRRRDHRRGDRREPRRGRPRLGAGAGPRRPGDRGAARAAVSGRRRALRPRSRPRASPRAGGAARRGRSRRARASRGSRRP